jgi:DNA-binding CsgD family transcriptional regulator
MSVNVMTATDHELAGEIDPRLQRLTPKEREALDLVSQRHTTKEIARLLDLSLNAVDTRLFNARDKLGARDRNDAVRIYLQLQQACGKTTIGSPPVFGFASGPLAAPPEPQSARFTLQDVASFTLPPPWEMAERVKLSEDWDRRFGRVWRVIAIPAGALGIALLALALIAIATNLGTLIPR